jgi:hypothetical protein
MIGLMEATPFGILLNEVCAAQTDCAGRVGVVTPCVRKTACAGCGRTTSSATASATCSPARCRCLEFSQWRRLHRIGFQRPACLGGDRIEQPVDNERPNGPWHTNSSRPIGGD